MEFGKSQEQNGGYSGSTKRHKVHFATLMHISSQRNAELEPKHLQKERVVLRGDTGKGRLRCTCSIDRARSFCVSNDGRKSNGCHCKTTCFCGTSICFKMEDAPWLLNIPKSARPDLWIRLPRHKWPKSRWSIEDPVVPLERTLYGHPLAGLVCERKLKEVLLGLGWEKVPNWECVFVHRKQGLFLSKYVDEYGSHVEEIDETCGFRRTNTISWPRKFEDELNVKVKRTRVSLTNMEKCSNHDFLLQQLNCYQGVKNLAQRRSHGRTTWKDMLRNALREIANWQTKTQSNCTKSQLRAWMITTSWRKRHELVGLTLLSWNKLARTATEWTRACDKRLARLISYIHHTNDYRQYCSVGNTAQHCRLGLFRDSDFAGDLEDSKSTSGGVLCIFGSRTFVPTNWMCNKQTSVSHSSTESAIILLDAGFSMDGILALDFWDAVTEVLHTSNSKSSTQEASGNRSGFKEAVGNCARMSNTKLRKSNQKVEQLSNLDHVTTNATSSQCEAQLYNFWRQRACDQKDHQKTKSNDERRVQDRQSRVR